MIEAFQNPGFRSFSHILYVPFVVGPAPESVYLCKKERTVRICLPLDISEMCLSPYRRKHGFPGVIVDWL